MEKKRGRPFSGQPRARQRAFRIPEQTDIRLSELAVQLNMNFSQVVVWLIDNAKMPSKRPAEKASR